MRNGDKGSRGYKDLNFKVSPEFHREFKLAAAARNVTMKMLLIESFRTLSHGDEFGMKKEGAEGSGEVIIRTMRGWNWSIRTRAVIISARAPHRGWIGFLGGIGRLVRRTPTGKGFFRGADV